MRRCLACRRYEPFRAVVFLQKIVRRRIFQSEVLDKALRTCYYRASWGLLAQLVEQLTLNQRVIGSNPIQPTIISLALNLGPDPVV